MDYVSGSMPVNASVQLTTPSQSSEGLVDSSVSGFKGMLQNAAIGTTVSNANSSSIVISGQTAVGNGTEARTSLSQIATTYLATDEPVSDTTAALSFDYLNPLAVEDKTLSITGAHIMGQVSALSALDESKKGYVADTENPNISALSTLQRRQGEVSAMFGNHRDQQTTIEPAVVLASGNRALKSDSATPSLQNIEVAEKRLQSKSESQVKDPIEFGVHRNQGTGFRINGEITLSQNTQNGTERESLASLSMGRFRSDDSSIQASTENEIDSLIRADRGLYTGMHQSASRGHVKVDNIALIQAPALESSITEKNAAKLQAMQMVEPGRLQLSTENGVAAAASAISGSVEPRLMSRHRVGEITEESVSQIAKGGNEARMLEINDARSSNGSVPKKTMSTNEIHTKIDSEAKHTSAAMLASTKDETLSPALEPVSNLKQISARVGGMDVMQIGAADLAASRVDVGSATQSPSRISILEPGWTNQLGSDLKSLVVRGSSTTQVQVTPAVLGPLDIEVSVNRQEVSVRIMAMHGQTREMLEAAIPRLREVLGQSYSGVDITVGSGAGSSSGHAQSQQNGGQATAMGMMQDGERGMRDSQSSQNSSLADSSDSGVNESADETAIQSASGEVSATRQKPARGLVDAYA